MASGTPQRRVATDSDAAAHLKVMAAAIFPTLVMSPTVAL